MQSSKPREPLMDPTGKPQPMATEKDVEGASEAHNKAIDADDLDLPDDEPDPSDRANR